MADQPDHDKHKVFNWGIVVIFLMVMLYIGFATFKEKFHLSFGHEAATVTLVGFAISYFVVGGGNTDFANMMAFNEQLFFYLVLPPIVFASGFNMQRKDFFGNFRNIVIFGICGTFICFIMFTLLTLLYTDWIAKGDVWQYNGATAVSLLNPQKQPKLFSVVFGEGITNDAVCIILFNTVMKFHQQSLDENAEGGFTLMTGFGIAWEFVTLLALSLTVGVIWGMFSSYLLKTCRSLTHNVISECTVLFAFAYLSYVSAELMSLSGIISLLACAMMEKEFSWLNMSWQGKLCSVDIFECLGLFAQGFVFSYLGLTFFFYQNYEWSVQLIVAEMVICIIARSTAVLGMLGIMKACGYEKDDPNKLTWKELIFITFAGLIRGAIAFGLVLRMGMEVANRSVIVTSSLTLVVFTTVVCGSTIGVLGKCLFPDAPKIDGEEDNVNDDASNYSLSQRSAQHTKEVITHLNELEKRRQKMRKELIEMEETTAERSCFDAFILYKDRLFEGILRPMLIYKYELKKIKNAREVFETFKSHAPNLDKMMIQGLKDGAEKGFSIVPGQELIDGGMNADTVSKSSVGQVAAKNTANLLRQMTLGKREKRLQEEVKQLEHQCDHKHHHEDDDCHTPV